MFVLGVRRQKRKKVLKGIEFKEQALYLRQKLIKISKDRLGIYLNKDIVGSLKLRAGKEVDISVADKKRIVINIL